MPSLQTPPNGRFNMRSVECMINLLANFIKIYATFSVQRFLPFSFEGTHSNILDYKTRFGRVSCFLAHFPRQALQLPRSAQIAEYSRVCKSQISSELQNPFNRGFLVEISRFSQNCNFLKRCCCRCTILPVGANLNQFSIYAAVKFDPFLSGN